MTHLAPLIQDLAIILGVAAITAFLFQKIKQPVVVGYLIAGLIVGPHTPPFQLVKDLPSIQTWAELGVIFLMFSLGLEFSFRKLTQVGFPVAVTAFIETPLMFAAGFFIGKLFHWSLADCLLLGAAISISSTTIIVKSLDDLKLKTRRFAQQIFGVLIVEDLIAILMLVAISSFATQTTDSMTYNMLFSLAKVALISSSWFILGYFALPRLVRRVGQTSSEELLTVLAIALCLGLVSFSSLFGFSSALGAFIMGSILAESAESKRIEELVKPLRDLFIAVFFVSIGMLINPQVFLDQWALILIITAVVVVGKVSTVTLGSLISGQTLRTAVQVGMGMAQIGEFSFIIVGLASLIGGTHEVLYPVIVAVSLMTTFLTPYFIRVSHKSAVALENKLPLPVKKILTQYSAWVQAQLNDFSQKEIFTRQILKWLISAIVIATVFLTSSKFLGPVLQTHFPWPDFLPLSLWAACILFSSPFAYSMFTAFKRESLSPIRSLVILFSRLLTVIYVGVLSLEFLSLQITVILVLATAAIFLTFFYRQLESTYQWFESSFLETFKDKNKNTRYRDPLKHLAPWDAHLVRLKVHPNSEISGLSLKEAAIREKFGPNVVAIQRGVKTIMTPKGEERIFPKDELLLLGTDDQIDDMRAEIEKPPGLKERFKDLSGYDLRQIKIGEASLLADKTIRETKIRERFGGLVVGIERGNKRSINPSSDHKIQHGDTLWVVGESDQLSELMRTYEGTKRE